MPLPTFGANVPNVQNKLFHTINIRKRCADDLLQTHVRSPHATNHS